MGSSTGGLGFGSTFNAPSFPSESSNQTLTAFGTSSTLGLISTTPTSFSSSSVFGPFTNHRNSSGFDGEDDAQSSTEITSTTNSPFLAPSTETQPSLFGRAGSFAFGQQPNINQVFGQKPTADFSFPVFPTSFHSNNHGTPNPFSAPFFSSKSGQPPFGSQHGGSGIAPYAVTIKTEQVSTNFMSISSMPVYDGKSHEELRWEDYQQRARANPFSASLHSENGQPPLVSQHGGSRIAPYSSSKADGEGSAKMVSISAMPVYFAKSHEELKWEDYRLRTEGGNGFGSLNRNSNLSIPSPFSSGLAAPVTNQIPFPTDNVRSSTLVEVPNLDRHQCTACGCIKTNAFTVQFQETQEPSQIESSKRVTFCLSFPTVVEPPTVSDSIVPVRDPFGVSSSESQLLSNPAKSASSTQIGISTMPVVDEPALGRVSSLLIEMHISQGQATPQSNTWQPKSDVNKEGTFFIPEDPHDIPRPVNHHPIPRENTNDADTTEPTENNADGKPVDVVLPKLSHPEYYTKPLISEMPVKETTDQRPWGGLDLDSLMELNAGMMRGAAQGGPVL